MNSNIPEILSPAGSRASLEAAVRSGADAVYLGATEFSARRNAENFDERQLEDAVKYCHIRGVRVYLALNILLSERELAIAVDIAKSAGRAGIDAIIVQDLGFANIIHKALPELPIHASTQMSVHSPSALPILKSLGICRVVAAREMSRNALFELCTAAKELDMSVEVFIHGALCMSVSGQCLLSAILGGRSGNRGLCAGPCRLPFAVGGGTGYDLSLKDLSLLNHISVLKSMGVASFKIEGRMKRPEYVAAATSAARAALDKGYVPENLAVALQEVFSRQGFTDGYFTENPGKEMFGVRTKEDVTSAALSFPMLHELYRAERQSVDIEMTALIKSGCPSKLIVTDGINTVYATGESPEPSQFRALTQESVFAALSKLGSTPYNLTKMNIDLDDGLFMRGSDLNSLRREVISLLNAERQKVKKRIENGYSISRFDRTRPKNPEIMVRVNNAKQIPENFSQAALIFPLECELPEKLPQKSTLIADIPRGILNEDAIRRRLGVFKQRGFTAALCNNLAAVTLAQKCGLEAIGGIGLNVYNTETAAVLAERKVNTITLSAELSLNEIIKMPIAANKGIFAYGRLPLMLTRNCPAANGRSCAECDKKAVLTDRKQLDFPIMCRAGFSEILNSKPIYLGDRMKELEGLDFIMLYFTDESPKAVESIINAYKKGTRAHGDGFTRGLYFRSTY